MPAGWALVGLAGAEQDLVQLLAIHRLV